MRFGAYFAQALLASGLTQVEFARRAGTQQQVVSDVIKGLRAPPLVRLEAWADVLSAHIERDRFMELGRLAHCPEEIIDLVMELRRQLGERKK